VARPPQAGPPGSTGTILVVTSGGWEWEADRERWVAHAPVDRAIVKLGLVAVAGQLFMMATAADDAPIHDRPWERAAWLAIVLVWGIHLLMRLRRQDVTYDGEVVAVVHGSARTTFRPPDIAAVRPGPLANRDLLVVRARPIERTFAGVPVPTLRRGARLRADVPSWWWHQIVGVSPDVTPWCTQRLWARLRYRPVAT
jgi:hypothetical protein